MSRRARLALALLLLPGMLALVGADAARGAALVSFEGNVATYFGAAGEPHAVFVSQLSSGQIEFREPGVVAGSACTQEAPDRVHCPSAFAGGIKVNLGSLNDTLDATKAVVLPVEAVGNAGNDTLVTGVGNDTLRGGEGDDTLEPSPAALPQPAGEQNTLFGGPGADRFLLGRSFAADRVVGGDSAVPATLPPGTSSDIFGTDIADYSARPAAQGGVAVNLGPGGPVNSQGARVASDGRGDGTEGDQLDQDVETVLGTVSSDLLSVDACDLVDANPDPNAFSPRTDCFLPGNLPRLEGGDGSDRLRGDQINNVLLGGTGDDDLDAERGFDTLEGGIGADKLKGGPASGLDADDKDTISGGDGDDQLEGGGGTDTMQGDAGADRLLGGPENDDMRGGAGNDEMHGELGRDTMRGEAGADSIRGTEDNDTIEGGDGDDSLNGDAGDDRVTGGLGKDTASGGVGTDRVFLRDGIADRCFILSSGADVIDADLADQAIMGNLCLPGISPPPGVTVQFSPVDELPPVRVRSKRLRLGARGASVRLSCPRVWRRRPCAGRIRLTGARGRPLLATGRYRVRAGRTRTVTLRLRPGARRRVAGRRTLRVTLVGRGRSRKGPSTVAAFVRPPQRR